MARIHNAISRGIFNDGLKRILGIQKAGDGLERFSETLQAVINPWQRHDRAFRLGELPLQGFGTQAAVVAERAHVLCRNPVGSGRLVYIESIVVAASAAIAVFRITRTTSLLGTEAAMTSRDTRLLPLVGTAGRALVVSHSQAGSLGTTGTLYAVNTTEDRLIEDGYTVAPGTSVGVVGNADNVGFSVTFNVIEREAFPGEL